MAITTNIPAKLVKSQIDGSVVVDFDLDTFKAMLVRAGSSIPSTSKTGVQYVSDVTAGNAEVSGGTYARQTLASITLAFGASDDVDWSFGNVTFAQDAGSGPTDARYAVIYKDVGGSDSTRPVICVIDLNATVSLRTGDLVLSAPAGGLIQWTKSP
jgi:hypothetical protein